MPRMADRMGLKPLILASFMNLNATRLISTAIMKASSRSISITKE